MLAVIVLTALAAGFVQAVSGFGGALVMMMSLPYFMEMKYAAALGGVICIPLCASLAWQYRKHIDWKLVFVPAVIYLVTSSISIRAAATLELGWLKAVFGILLILLAVYFSFFSSKIHIEANFKTALICAGLSGVTGGLFGIGGPLMVLYYLAVTDNTKTYLGTINILFLITELYNSIIRYYNGLIRTDMWQVVICGFVAIIIGQFFGTKAAGKLNPATVKKSIYVMLAVSGLVTFLRAVGLF